VWGAGEKKRGLKLASSESERRRRVLMLKLRVRKGRGVSTLMTTGGESLVKLY